jgi:hypothetical protein
MEVFHKLSLADGKPPEGLKSLYALLQCVLREFPFERQEDE